MQPTRIVHFKELLDHLTKQHQITITIKLWTYNQSYTYHVLYDNIKHLFDNDMLYTYNHKPLIFTDIYNNTHTFETNNKNNIRVLNIKHYQITGPIHAKIKNFKDLLTFVERTNRVIVAFKIQRKHNRPFNSNNTTRKPDTFHHYKTTFRRIKQQFNCDLYINQNTQRNLSFKTHKNKHISIPRHRIRHFHIKYISIFKKENGK